MTKYLWIGLPLLLASCYYDVESELYAGCDNPIEVLYSVHVEPVINASCAISGCHIDGGSGTGNMETYDGVKAMVDAGTFQQRTLEQRNMPPSGSLGTCDLLLLQDWIDQGALNN